MTNFEKSTKLSWAVYWVLKYSPELPAGVLDSQVDVLAASNALLVGQTDPAWLEAVEGNAAAMGALVALVDEAKAQSGDWTLVKFKACRYAAALESLFFL